jgi:hypothetical protein
MSDILGKIRSGAGKVAKEADRVAHVKRIELEIGSINRQVENHYNKLGEMAYKSNVNKEPENPEAPGIIAKITELHQQIKVKEEEIARINEGKSEPQAPPTPGKKICTSCGKDNDVGVKFCSECGVKMS